MAQETANARPASTGPVWGTWKSHGNLSALTYFGKSLKAPAAEGTNIVISTGPQGLQGLDAQTGKPVLTGGTATKFWASPWDEAESNQIPEAAARPARPANDTAPHMGDQSVERQSCGCGCGQPVRRQFAVGHDQRHLSNLRRAVAAGTLAADAALAQAALVSPAFAGKVARSMAAVAREQEHAQDQAPDEQATDSKAA